MTPETTADANPGNFFSQLTGVYFSPGETFKAIGLAPNFIIPLILLAIISGIASWVLVNRIGAVKLATQGIEKRVAEGKMTPEQAAPQIEAIKQRESIIKATIPIFGVVGTLIAIFVIAGVFKLATMALGAENTFSQMLSVTAYTYLAVSIISTVVFVIILYLKSPEEIDIQNPIGSNLGALLTMLMGNDLPKFITTFASWIDVFSIWKIALLSIGYSAVSRRLKIGSAAMIVIGLYFLAAIGSSIWASIF